VALIAWKTLVPASSLDEDQVAAALADLKEAQQELSIAEARLQSQRETMDQAVAALAPGESFSELQQKVDQAASLERQVETQDLAVRAVENDLLDVRGQLDKATALQGKLEGKITALETDKKELTATLKSTEARLAKHEPPKKADGKTETAGGDGSISIWWWVGGGVLAALVLVAGVWWLGERKNNDDGGENADTQNESKRSETNKDGASNAGN
jgi:hypothetical protein